MNISIARFQQIISTRFLPSPPKHPLYLQIPWNGFLLLNFLFANQKSFMTNSSWYSWLMNWKCCTFGNELVNEVYLARGASDHMSLLVSLKCLTLKDQIQKRKTLRYPSVRRRTEENEAIGASLSPAHSSLHGMLSTEVPSTSGRWFWWMPTKLPLFMRNILTLLGAVHILR